MRRVLILARRGVDLNSMVLTKPIASMQASPQALQLLAALCSIRQILRLTWVDGTRSILKCDNLAFPACWHQETAMATSGFQHLTLDERRSLFRMQEARLGVAEMAARLGRHRLTIYRELGRNRFRDPDASRDSRRNMSGYYCSATIKVVAGVNLDSGCRG